MGFFSFLNPPAGRSADAALVRYFQKKPYGTEPPVVTIFQVLPPKDKCAILSELLKRDRHNAALYSALSLAHLQNNEPAAARRCLE